MASSSQRIVTHPRGRHSLITFHASRITQRIATRVDGTLYYVHSDHLGSTVAVSDAAGQAVGRVQYDPYGEIITSTLPVTLTDRLFTGQRFDSSTGLYYYNARYYDPDPSASLRAGLGRFIQPDTLVPDPLNPQAWNRFSYVYNNPTSYVDPGGHIAWVPILIFGGAFLLGAGMGGYYAYHQGYGFESWQLYAYAGMGGLAGVAGAATGMWIEAALLPVGATAGQALVAGAAGGFAAGVVEQSILEVGGAAILGTEVSGERILLAGVTGGVTGGIFAAVGRAIGTVRVYHGTDYPEETFAGGVKAAGGGQLGPGFYVSPERRTAEWYARNWGTGGGRPALLYADMPRRWGIRWLTRAEYSGLSKVWGRPIPPELSYLMTDFDIIAGPVRQGGFVGTQFKFNVRAQQLLNSLRWTYELLP